ncbi:RNA-directed DNA polymerase, eukaryota, reverse transcriptase zinc-binding domain protein [Tanacetum coccineum]
MPMSLLADNGRQWRQGSDRRMMLGNRVARLFVSGNSNCVITMSLITRVRTPVGFLWSVVLAESFVWDGVGVGDWFLLVILFVGGFLGLCKLETSYEDVEGVCGGSAAKGVFGVFGTIGIHACGDGIAIIKRRRQDLHRDGVKDLVTASGRGRLKEDLESSTWRRRHDFKCAKKRFRREQFEELYMIRLFHSWFNLDGFDKMVEDTWKSLATVDSNGGNNEEILSDRSLLLKELNDINSIDSLEAAQKSKVHWAIEGDENTEFFHGTFPLICNSSFIALIPKIHDAKVVKDYHPISLIGSLYKIISKILANRLSFGISGLISDVQSAFISNRQILNGLFILNELISWCKHKKFKAMVFKFDFEKAFDSIQWNYLHDVGFQRFLQLSAATYTSYYCQFYLVLLMKNAKD